MDVYLASNGIHYLSEDCISLFSTLKVLSKEGAVVKMNPLVLAAMNCSLVRNLPTDMEDVCVLTEFSKDELEDIYRFSMFGTCSQSSLLKDFGINLKKLFLPKPDDEEVLQVKCEPADLNEITEIDNDDFSDTKDENFSSNFLDPSFMDESKRLDRLDELEEQLKLKQIGARVRRHHKLVEDDEDDDTWTPDDWRPSSPIPRPTKQSSRKKQNEASGLKPELRAKFADYELPKPLDSYIVPPSKVVKNNKAYSGPSKAHTCHICSTSFTNGKILKQHVIKIHSEHYKCDVCQKGFSLNQKYDLKLHMFKHDQNILGFKKINCVQCGNTFGRPHLYRDHMTAQGPQHNDQCSQCPRKFKTYEEYKSHVDEEHYGKWRYKCGFCGDTFDEKKEQRTHLLFHTTPNGPSLERLSGKRKRAKPVKKMCPECGLDVYNLSNHLAGVHGNQEHTCHHCGMVMKTKARLNKHIEWLHETAPCSECGEMIGVAKMKRHMATKHTSIYDRKFKCTICAKSFCENSRLKDHMNTHTGEKPYKCKYCSACFASAGTHAMHQRGHLGHRRSK